MKKSIFILALILLVSHVCAADFTIEAETMTPGGPYAGTVSNPFSGIALYGNGDKGTTTHAFPDGDGIYKVTIIGASNNSSSAGVSLYINDVKVKAYAFYGTTPSSWELDLRITGLTSSNTVVLLLETDNGSSDTYVDKITFSFQGPIVVKEPPVIPAQGAYYTGEYRNMLKEAGYSDIQINQKLEDLWNHFFYGDSDTEAVYYPVGDDEAYMLDTGNGDIRSEGMSYGMMICVQLDKQTEFNRLWKWAKTRMQQNSGTQKGYFSWQITTDGATKSQHAAPDGDEYFVMALMFAAGRWGNGEGIYNYWQEANDILKNSLSKGHLINSSVTNLFNETEKQVVFVPYASSAKHTDPSYHLPAFYQLWSHWADSKRSFWASLADKSREMFPKFANAQTGLMPDYANFDGTATGGSHADFRYDAWRCIMNVAMDYSWFQADETQIALVNRIHNFFESQGVDSYGSEYSLVGKKLNSDHSPGLVACNAAGALASNQTVAWDFIEDFFNINIPTGRYRYYDGLLYFMNYLNLSGNYRIYKPAEVLETALDEQYQYADGYLIMDDFEAKETGDEYYMRRTEGSSGAATVTANPANALEKSLQVLPGNYDEQFVLEFTLPEGKTLKNDYSQLEFDIYYTKKSDDGNQNQDLKVDFDVIQSKPFFTVKTGDRANHDKWEHITVPLNGVTSGNSFKLYIWIRTRAANFYVDNIKLKANYTIPPIPSSTTETEMKLNVYYSNEVISLNSVAEKFSIYDLKGNLLISMNNVSSLNVSNLSSGVYIIQTYVNGKIFTNKFVK